MARRRQAWFDEQPELDPERLIFIDESGASTKMARLRGRARRGERCRAAVPHGHWKTTTFVGALRLRGMTAPMVLDDPMNGPAFLAYVERVLVPTLAAGGKRPAVAPPVRLRWPWLPGQVGGEDKLVPGSDYAAIFRLAAAAGPWSGGSGKPISLYASSGVRPASEECGRRVL